ncbi:SDR family NAD(P)-dependent oxidoreductase [Croceicoccus sp. F390]|uniref:SDR family NAD(P)-dependent oxidoreductase n=1 Tax=Croceicoccus esteveae TaxID=3075597 RepID=A0ABU2ZGL4_9SPHN|nr:SDR family NAD(P)-dependent oxidoreductase [Croceicoccus sp. F390]MDT0575521.1 SDR family NAD(P)-dependent oxidoreductase [Croceicoccus sp. F390]
MAYKRFTNCVVLGASGGVGAAICARLAGDTGPKVIHAGGRTAPALADVASIAAIRPFFFDYADETSLEKAAAQIAQAGPVDLCVVATGVLQSLPQIRPERSWRSIDADAMAEVFMVNTIGPALAAKHFVPIMRKDAASVFLAISARVGSVGDNRLGGWHSYRASKAALNMIVRNVAIELERVNPGAVAVAYHPGTVRTGLSEPFTGSTAEQKLFTPDNAAAKLLDVASALQAEDSGSFVAFDGSKIAW